MEIFNAAEFIEYVRRNKHNFIQYCEVLIDRDGNIIRCVPSHAETVLKYVMREEGKTREEVINE